MGGKAALVVVLTLLTLASTIGAALGSVVTQPAAPCSPARSSIHIEALASGLNDVTYTIVNRRPDPIRRIWLGTSQGFLLEAKEMPKIRLTPAGWAGAVVRDEQTGHVHLDWEATSDASALQAGSQTEFGISVLAWWLFRPGGGTGHRFDFRSVPFKATTVSGACWSGTTSNPQKFREGGAYATLRGAAVRVIEKPGDNAVLIDVPLRENQGRLGRGVFLSVPLAVTFGVTGGFSADLSIGAGITWAPSPYVSASAKTRFGTFFFNNRTSLRSVGVDLSIPIERRLMAENLIRGTRFLVIGIEYFQRDVVKWAGFMDGPQWYASGSGVAIRAGIRVVGWSGP